MKRLRLLYILPGLLLLLSNSCYAKKVHVKKAFDVSKSRCKVCNSLTYQLVDAITPEQKLPSLSQRGYTHISAALVCKKIYNDWSPKQIRGPPAC